MKTIKRNILLFISAIMFALSTIAFAASVNTASADDAVSTFVMSNGAYVRLTEENSGIRFTAKVPDETHNYYMLIVPKDLLTAKGITSDYVTELAKAYPDQPFAKMACTPFTYKSELMIAGSLVNLQDQNYKREFVGIAYYTEGEEGSLTYTYADFEKGYDIFSNSRNIAKVASSYLNEGNTEGEEIAESMIEKAFEADGFGESKSWGFEKDSQALTVSAYNYKTLTLNNSFDLSVKLESSDADVAEVNGTILKAKANGTSKITAKIGDGEKFSVSYTVNVSTPVAKTWIDTDTAAYADARSNNITYLEEYDGENGVLHLNHSTGDGGIGQLNLAFPASHYDGEDVVVLRIKGTSGVFVTYGNSSSWNFKNENCMTLTDEWKNYEFKISSLLSKSGGDDTLQSLSDNGMFYFNSVTDLYLADAYTYKNVSLNGSVTEENGKYVYTDNVNSVLSGYTITDKKFIDGNGNAVALNENGEFTPLRTTSVYKVVYTATKDGKVVKAQSSVTVYTKELSLYDFNDENITVGSAGVVSYDSNEKAVKIAYPVAEFVWLLRGKMINTDSVSNYSKVTFKIKTDSTTNGVFWVYPEPDMKYGYLITGKTGDGYAEYTVNSSLLINYITNYNNTFMVYLYGFSANSSIWIKDIYLSGLNDGFSASSVYDFRNETIASNAANGVSYDTEETALKITGNGFFGCLRYQMRFIDNPSEYTKVTFKIKTDSTTNGTLVFYDEQVNMGLGYNITVKAGEGYAEYTVDASFMITYMDTTKDESGNNVGGINEQSQIYLEGFSEGSSVWIQDIYLSK